MKKEQGITLISLVVTIIVLIILAGVSINIILGQDGIINKAKEAKQNMEYAQIEEQEQLNELYIQLETQGISPGSESYDAIVKLSEFKTKVSKAITEMGVETSENADATTMANNIKAINIVENEYKLHNLEPYNNRCTIDNGGYYIKDGVCYVDLVVTMLSTTSNNGTITGFPTRKNASITEYLCVIDKTGSSSSIFFRFNSNEVPLSSAATNGHTIRIYGAYETTEGDI